MDCKSFHGFLTVILVRQESCSPMSLVGTDRSSHQIRVLNHMSPCVSLLHEFLAMGCSFGELGFT
jgi:hypothetical protein